MRTPTIRFAKEFTLLEHTHYALSCAKTTEDFYTIVTGLLVSPQLFNFARAFILKINDRSETIDACFTFSSPGESSHNDDLSALLPIISKGNGNDISVIRHLFNTYLKSFSRDAVCELSFSDKKFFSPLSLPLKNLEEDHVIKKILKSTRAQKYVTIREDVAGLDFLNGYFLAGTLSSQKGKHGILIVDLGPEGRDFKEEHHLHFQWFLNHAAMALFNIELIEQLTFDSKQVSELDKIKNDLLSIVSHEFLTPLTGILGYVNLMLAEKFGPVNLKQEDTLRSIIGHGNHLHTMVNDLLELAEVNSGGLTDVSLQQVNCVSSMINIIPKLNTRRGNKTIEISPAVLPDAIPLIYTDPNSLERILYHLLDNALKFSPQDGRVTVSYIISTGFVEIQIKDYGIGISAKQLRKIFDHFYQIDFTLERQYGGMGIGLTIVKLLLEASGGTIRVESQVGVGSMFAVKFPVLN